jgi:sRNA-binding carbon storage regulator CsrA
MQVVSRRVDQWVMVGDDILVGPTDIDPRTVRILAKGRMIGGPQDGGTFQQVHELSAGQSFGVGPLIVVTLLDIRGDEVNLGISAPPHVPVSRSELREPTPRREDD